MLGLTSPVSAPTACLIPHCYMHSWLCMQRISGGSMVAIPALTPASLSACLLTSPHLSSLPPALPHLATCLACVRELSQAGGVAQGLGRRVCGRAGTQCTPAHPLTFIPLHLLPCAPYPAALTEP